MRSTRLISGFLLATSIFGQEKPEHPFQQLVHAFEYFAGTNLSSDGLSMKVPIEDSSSKRKGKTEKTQDSPQANKNPKTYTFVWDRILGGFEKGKSYTALRADKTSAFNLDEGVTWKASIEKVGNTIVAMVNKSDDIYTVSTRILNGEARHEVIVQMISPNESEPLLAVICQTEPRPGADDSGKEAMIATIVDCAPLTAKDRMSIPMAKSMVEELERRMDALPLDTAKDQQTIKDAARRAATYIQDRNGYMAELSKRIGKRLNLSSAKLQILKFEK